MKALLFVCVAGSLAYADDADPSSSEPAPTPNAPVAAAPAAAGGDWAEINTRPLVLPTGKLDVHGNFSILAFNDGMGTSASEALAFGVNYGAADKIEVGADYTGIQLNPNATAEGAFDLRGSYSLMHTDKLDVSLNGGLNIAFVPGIDATTTPPTETTNTDLAIEIGATARYHVTPKVSVFTGLPALPPVSSLIGLPGFYQLTIGVNNSAPITLDLPVGVSHAGDAAGLRVCRDQHRDGSASPTRTTAFIFADAIPISIGAYYSVSNQLDVGVQFTDDLENAGDFYLVSFVGRYYVK